MMDTLKRSVRAYSNLHVPGPKPNLFIFSTPRSGSTWLMELIRTQPGFKSCEEPLNLRNPEVRRYLGLSQWQQLYEPQAAEILERYFAGFCQGNLRFMNGNPFNRYNRLITHRIVFKILHGGEDRIAWFAEKFNGRSVLLLRHPLAVTISREAFPRLEAMLTTNFQTHFTAEQLAEAQLILHKGNTLQKGVLSWCLQNSVALNQINQNSLVLTYEQLVLEPEPLLHQLAKTASLSKPEWMIASLRQPSNSYRKSDPETRKILAAEQADKRQLMVSKWRKKVDNTTGAAAMEILKLFNLELYSFENDLPNEKFWLKEVQCELIR